MSVWASVSQFLPHNSATFEFQVLMSMQMDAKFNKEQIGTLFFWVGALEGGVGGWVVGRGVKPKNRTCLPSEFFSCLLTYHTNFGVPVGIVPGW